MYIIKCLYAHVHCLSMYTNYHYHYMCVHIHDISIINDL